MSGTSAGNAAGKNLCTLGDKLAKTRNILIIDSFHTVNTEMANLFTGFSVHCSVVLLVFHFNKPPIYRMRQNQLLKGQIVIRHISQLGKIIAACVAVGAGRFGIACGGIARRCGITLGFHELNIVCNYLKCGSVVTVFIGIFTGLNAALNTDKVTLFEIFCNKFRLLTPSDYIYKISLPFFA